MIGTPPVVLPQIRAGKLRALSLTTRKSSAIIPGISVGRSGLRPAGCRRLVGIVGARAHAAGRDPHTVRHALKVLGNPQIRERLAREGLEIETSASPQQFAAFNHNEISYWAKVVRESGATAD
jgi:tripartite-type tricarboxylate transporter receptor subunit TctC